MRKSLFCGAALAVLAVASAAHAEDANVTSGLQLKLSGRIGFLAGVLFNDNRSPDIDRDYDFMSGYATAVRCGQAPHQFWTGVRRPHPLRQRRPAHRRRRSTGPISI